MPGYYRAQSRAKIRRHARLLNADGETKKVAIGFLSIQIMRSYPIKPLLAPSLLSLFSIAQQLLFCGRLVILATLHVGGNCMFAGLHQNKVGVYHWGPSPLTALTSPNGRNQIQKKHFFSVAPPSPGQQQEHQNRCIIVSWVACIPCIGCITQNTSNSQLSQYQPQSLPSRNLIKSYSLYL